MIKRGLVLGGISVGLYFWLQFVIGLMTPRVEKYIPIVEEVQEQAVMLTVPSVIEQTYITFSKKGMKMHTSTQAVNFSGSGVFVSRRGHILTCAHVVDHPLTSPVIVTLSDNTTAAAYVLVKDTATDLALIKIDKKTPKAHLSSVALRLGQEVIAVGNPHSQQFSTSHGIISHLNRGVGEPYMFTQVDAPINGGNSGGPLFNLRGELIGIVARKWGGADGMGLAITPQTIKDFLDLLKQE